MDIQTIKRLLSEATPGPWEAKDAGSSHKGEIHVYENSIGGYEHIATTYCGAYEGHGGANARLMAAAPEAITFLLGELEKVRLAVDVVDALEVAFDSGGWVEGCSDEASDELNDRLEAYRTPAGTRDAQKAQGAK